jgi:hypothetical protein
LAYVRLQIILWLRNANSVFIRTSTTGFCIISVYVNDLNIIGHKKDIDEACNHLKMEFEMKDLSRTKFFLGLHLEHLDTGILVH